MQLDSELFYDMFGPLISFVNLLRSVANDMAKKQSERDRDEMISRMLDAYFYLKDAVDEGEALVDDAAPDPAATIASLPSDLVQFKLAEWEQALKRQGFRLHRVSELIFSQDHIEVVRPDLKDALYEAIGSKFNRATSLHGIGSALFFRSMFPLNLSQEEQAHYVNVMAGAKGSTLNMRKIKSEILDLRTAMQAYREAITDLASGSDILKLSNTSRARTTLPRKPATE